MSKISEKVFRQAIRHYVLDNKDRAKNEMEDEILNIVRNEMKELRAGQIDEQDFDHVNLITNVAGEMSKEQKKNLITKLLTEI